MEETDHMSSGLSKPPGVGENGHVIGTPGAFLAIVKTCALISVGAVVTLGGWSRNVTAFDVCG